MSFFRGGLLVIVGILLFLSLLLGNVFLVLSTSLQYDNVKSGLVPIVQEFVDDQTSSIVGDFNLTEDLEEAREIMQDYCQNNTAYVFSEGRYNFTVSCDLVNEPLETFVEQGIDSIIEQTYYKEYDCGFWDCFGKESLPLFLVSEKAKDYWKEKFYFSILVSIVLIILIPFLTEQKMNFPIIFGGLLALSSLPLLKLGGLSSIIAGQSSLEFVSFFFNKSGNVFWIVFIVGLLIFGSGIALRLLNLESIKKKLSRKDVRQIVRNEVQSSNRK